MEAAKELAQQVIAMVFTSTSVPFSSSFPTDIPGEAFAAADHFHKR